MKKFEPHYRLVRYGQATKVEKASRQQRRFLFEFWLGWYWFERGREIRGGWRRDGGWRRMIADDVMNRETTQEPSEDCPGYGEDEGSGEEEEVERGMLLFLCW